jgi:hypothetical protein
MLKIVGNINGNYHSRVIDNIEMTHDEAAVAGSAYKLSSGVWTAAVDADRIYAICLKSATGGDNIKPVMEIVKDGDIIEADYTGTADAAFVVGLEAASLGDADSANVDAADVTGGHLVILEKDTTLTKVRCIATKNFVQAS